jgi:multiple sugar transport system permease protein
VSETKPRTFFTVIGWVILIIPLLLMLFLFVNPIIQNLTLSMTKANGFTEPQFIGLDNYQRMGQDERFLSALTNTFLSPALFLRILLLAAAPLSLALLFMELRSGLRITLQAILAPLIVFSGAVVTAFIYYTYFSPMEGLAGRLTGGEASLLADPGTGYSILQNFLLANGLAWSLPLGIALFLGAMRGVNLAIADKRMLYREFWSRAGRLLAVMGVGVIGFSLINLEGSYMLRLPLGAGDNLFNYFFNHTFRMMRLGYGAAAVQYLILPLLMLGVGFMLLLELPRSRVSIRPAARNKNKLTAGSVWGAGRITAMVLAGVLTLVTLVLLVFIVVLPWLGSLTGLGGRGAEMLTQLVPDLLAGMARSYLSAVPFALFCLVITAAAGFAFGFLRPRGGKAAFIIVGSFIFISPALLLIPYYLTFRNFVLIDTLLALGLPALISPLGIILFTLLFRGLRDEKDAIEAGGLKTNPTVTALRALGTAGLFSVPVFAIYLLAALNQVLLPITMLMRVESATLPFFLMRLQGEYGMSGIGLRAGAGQLALIQYWPPLALLIVGIIVVFPRLALVIRKKGEPVPPPEPEVIEKLKA